MSQRGQHRTSRKNSSIKTISPAPPNFVAATVIARSFRPGNAGGFFYLMCTGEVLVLMSPGGFDERFVLLDDASFFEVSGPLGAQDNEGAVRFRRIFRARSRVLRVLYTASVGQRSREAIAEQVMTAFGRIFFAILEIDAQRTYRNRVP